MVSASAGIDVVASSMLATSSRKRNINVLGTRLLLFFLVFFIPITAILVPTVAVAQKHRISRTLDLRRRPTRFDRRVNLTHRSKNMRQIDPAIQPFSDSLAVFFQPSSVSVHHSCDEPITR
jgi:putative effector of murein hydrolase LrgA (UPF0299 family)